MKEQNNTDLLLQLDFATTNLLDCYAHKQQLCANLLAKATEHDLNAISDHINTLIQSKRITDFIPVLKRAIEVRRITIKLPEADSVTTLLLNLSQDMANEHHLILERIDEGQSKIIAAKLISETYFDKHLLANIKSMLENTQSISKTTMPLLLAIYKNEASSMYSAVQTTEEVEDGFFNTEDDSARLLPKNSDTKPKKTGTKSSGLLGFFARKASRTKCDELLIFANDSYNPNS